MNQPLLNGRIYVSYPILWTVGTALIITISSAVITAFNWHNQQPHVGAALRVDLLDMGKRLDKRLERIEDKLDALQVGTG
tara:strand:+ start:524 stop:763 length:240 start_codon:yes stop_codon:yes gene_type:complete